jgi:hypothetical protein
MNAPIQQVLGETAGVCFCQLARKCFKRAFPKPEPSWCCVELILWLCALWLQAMR